MRFRSTFVAAAMLTAASASAVVVYDNFGPGETHGSQGAIAILLQDVGMGFTSTVSGSLQRITLALRQSAIQYTISLHALGTGVQPGSILESWTYTAPATGPATFTSAGATQLVAGNEYVIVLKHRSSFPGDYGQWMDNSIGAQGYRYLSTEGRFARSVGTNGAFRVEAVPEPATLAALGIGASWLALRRRNSKRG